VLPQRATSYTHGHTWKLPHPFLNHTHTSVNITHQHDNDRTLQAIYCYACYLEGLLEVTHEPRIGHPCSIRIASTVAGESMNVSLLEAAGATVGFLRIIWCCLHLQNRVFNMHFIGFLLRAAKPESKLALTWPRYYVSPETQVSH